MDQHFQYVLFWMNRKFITPIYPIQPTIPDASYLILYRKPIQIHIHIHIDTTVVVFCFWHIDFYFLTWNGIYFWRFYWIINKLARCGIRLFGYVRHRISIYSEMRYVQNWMNNWFKNNHQSKRKLSGWGTMLIPRAKANSLFSDTHKKRASRVRLILHDLFCYFMWHSSMLGDLSCCLFLIIIIKLMGSAKAMIS